MARKGKSKRPRDGSTETKSKAELFPTSRVKLDDYVLIAIGLGVFFLLFGFLTVGSLLQQSPPLMNRCIFCRVIRI